MEEKDVDFILKLHCQHEYCDDCLATYVRGKFKEHVFPIKVLPCFSSAFLLFPLILL